MSINTTNSQLIDQSLLLVYDALNEFSNDPLFDNQIAIALGKKLDASAFQTAWANGNFEGFPKIEVRAASEINGANGAFSPDTGKIYLAQEFLDANANNPEAIATVLIQELGDYLKRNNPRALNNMLLLFALAANRPNAGGVGAYGQGHSHFNQKFSPARRDGELNNLLLFAAATNRNDSASLVGFSPSHQNAQAIDATQTSIDVEASEIDGNGKELGDEVTADTVISRTIFEVSKNTEAQLEQTEVKDNLTVVFAETLQIDDSSGLDLFDVYGIVDQALQDTYDYLSKFRFDPEYTDKLETAFGDDFDREVADQLFDNFAQGNFTDLPTIKIVNRDAIAGGNGAFSVDTGLAYLAVEFIAENSQNTPKITDVLLEEAAHSIDPKINEVDALGDEGDILSELVQGNILNEQQLQQLKTEDDTAVIVLDNNQKIRIEKNFNPNNIDPQELPWNLKQINVWDAWRWWATGEGQTIAVIDSGVTNHTGFQNRFVNSYNFQDPQQHVTNIDDSHGTSVASAALANDSNSNVFGVAPDARLMPLKVTKVDNDSGEVYYDADLVIQAFNWAIDNQADVINTSFGFNFDSDPQRAEQQKEQLKDAIEKAQERNIIITVAAGNYGQNWGDWLNPNKGTPQLYQQFSNSWAKFLAEKRFPNVIVVGATEGSGRIADLSNYNFPEEQMGLPVHLAAPSGDNHEDHLNSIRVLNPNGATEQVIGTSFAAPQVAGAIALIKGYYPGLTYHQINQFLRDNVNKDRNAITTYKHMMKSPYPNYRRSLMSGMVWEGSLNVGNIFNRYTFQMQPSFLTENGLDYRFVTYTDTQTNEQIYLLGTIPAQAPQVLAVQVQALQSPDSFSSASSLSLLSAPVDGESVSTTTNTIQATTPDFDSFSSLLVIGGEGANVSVDGDIMTINGVISAAIGGIAEYPLFRVNNLQIDLKNGPVATFTEAAGTLTNGFTLLGLNLKFTNFELQENSIQLGAQLTAPELGILEEAALTIDPISISTDGISVGQASFTPWTGKKEFDAFGLMLVALENPELSFDFQEEVGTLHGKLYIPTLNDLTVDISKTTGKGLKFRQGRNGTQTEYALDVSITNGMIPIYGDWKLDDINVDLKKSFDETTITGLLGAKLYTSKDKFIQITGAYKKLKETDKNGVFTFTADSGEGTDFSVFGTDIDIRKIQFESDIDPTDDDYWDPQLQLQGKLTLPDALGKATANVTGTNYLVVNNEGLDLTGGIITIPNFDVNLLGLERLKIRAAEDSTGNPIPTTIEYSNVDEKYFKIQGKLQLPNFYNLTADFSGSNYIKISNDSANPVEVIGTFSAENINIATGVTIKYAELGINTKDKIVEAKGTLEIPSGIEIGAEVIFEQGILTYADIRADHLNKPIGTTGAYLQAIEGKYEDDLATPQADDFKFSGDLSFTAGPEVHLDLPDWLGGGFHGSLIELDVHGEITKDYLDVNGHLQVLGGLIEGNASAELHWSDPKNDPQFRPYFKAHTDFDIFDGLITTKTDLLALFATPNDPNTYFEVYMFGAAKVSIPNFVPWIGGKELGSGEVYFQYTDDGNYSNDYVAAWSSVWLLGTVGIKVSFDGNWKVIWEEDANAIRNQAEKAINLTDKTLEGVSSADNGKSINPTDGNDTLHGDDGADNISGRGGDDLLSGEGGNDVLNGNDGHDLLHGGSGDDTLNGGNGNDFLYGDDGNDELNGGTGDDYLDAGSGLDNLNGGLGNDTLLAGTGNSTLNGGDGIDTADYSSNPDGTVIGNLIADLSAGTATYGSVANISTGFNPSSDNRVLILDGVDDYVSIPDSDTIDFGYDQNFTIEAWIKADSAQVDKVNGDNDIIEKWSGSGAYPFVIRYIHSSGKIVAARYDGSNNPVISSSIAINDDQFHHVAFVKKGNKLYLYIDGKKAGETDDTTNQSTQNSSPLHLGNRADKNHFKGLIDEVRIWNIARRADQIANNYNKTLNVNEPQPGLVGYWNFDQGSVDGTIPDQTANRNDGTLVVGSHNDTLRHIENVIGGSGDDLIKGDNNKNHLEGRAGNDTLNGGAGDDSLEGEAGNDRLIGGDGNDTLKGGSGDDTLTGGSGYDTFFINPQAGGANIITDFDPPQVLSLDGVNDYVSIPDSDSIDFGVAQNFTVEAWIKANSAQADLDMLDNNIIEKWSHSGAYPFVIRYDRSSGNGKIVAARYDGSNNPVIQSSIAINDDQFHHVAFVKDGNNLYLYIDGVLDGTTTDTTTYSTQNNSPLFIGRRGGNPLFDNHFKGEIDEVRIWNVARSATEISDNYNQTLTGTETGLVGYWNFDGGSVNGNTITDLTGNGHNGTLQNGQVNHLVAGAIGGGDKQNALSLDGVDDYVSIPDSDSIDFDTHQDFTVEAWIKANSAQADLDQLDNSIIEKWSHSGGYPFVIRYDRHSSNGKIVAARYDGSNNPVIQSSIAINDDQFHHVAFVKDGNNLYLYIDGVLDGTTTDTTTYSTQNNSPLFIGRRGGNPLFDNHFKGEVDEVRIWDVARSESDIRDNYERTLTGNETGLVGYWNFDENSVSGHTITDKSKNSNDGTLVNGQDNNFVSADKISIDVSSFRIFNMDLLCYDSTTGHLSFRDFLSPIKFFQAPNANQYSSLYILSKPTTWDEAQKQARNLGGNLVAALQNNQDKKDWLLKTFGSNEDFWIGGSNPTLLSSTTPGGSDKHRGIIEIPIVKEGDFYYISPLNTLEQQNLSDLAISLSGELVKVNGSDKIKIDPQKALAAYSLEKLATFENKPTDIDKKNDIEIVGDYVELFSEDNYSGESLILTSGQYNYTDLFTYGFNQNILSSFKLPEGKGWQIALYEENNLEKRIGTYEASTPDLGKNSNKTSSFIISTPKEDFLIGGNGVDVINGLEGDDTIYGRDGNDTLSGWDGNDQLDGGNGDDEINGGNGDDLQKGGDGKDTLWGWVGNDRLYGGKGDDGINGGDGDDTIYGGEGDDILSGDYNGQSQDSDKGNANDLIYGGDGDDYINGHSGNDTIYGEKGLDVLDGKDGEDVLDGGDGADTIYGGEGDDQLLGQNGNDDLMGGAGADTLHGGYGADDLYGAWGNDSITGGDGDDHLEGGYGNDTLVGGSGADILAAAYGKDELTGGEGGDRFVFTPSKASAENTHRITDFDLLDAYDKIILIIPPETPRYDYFYRGTGDKIDGRWTEFDLYRKDGLIRKTKIASIQLVQSVGFEDYLEHFTEYLIGEEYVAVYG